ncbi:MAG: 3-dehydroquinate synthase [Cypionkella sp.]
MAVVEVALAGRSYCVHIGRGLLGEAGTLAAGLIRGRAVVVADRTAWGHHGEAFARGLGAAPALFLVEPGEASKSWTGLAALTDWLLAHGVERGDHLVAFGGGVVGDLAGFAAAIVKRGCGFIQVPTTLLAQVDSSVGGKTAINSAAGKNLVGAFHQPALVLADLAVLDTLPLRELRAGYAEVLKYAVLGDRAFFDWLAANGPAVLAREPHALEHAVATSVAMKAAIVAEDERETTGRRALLNLGHTFGHALEAETGFSDRLLHGEAVALGMVLAARFSARRGLLPDAAADAITRAVDAAGLPSEIAALGLDANGARLVEHMRHDKKMAAGALPFVLLRGVGEAFLARDVDLAEVAAFLDEQLQGPRP